MLKAIVFSQDGCSACRDQEPITREVAKSLPVTIEEINPLVEKKYIEKYQLQVTPTIVVIKDGSVVERFDGLVSRETLEAAIRRHL